MRIFGDFALDEAEPVECSALALKHPFHVVAQGFRAGLGPKKVKALHDKLGLETIEQLEQSCREGKVAELEACEEPQETHLEKL